MPCWYWPAAVAEHEEEHTEDDAGDSDVNADYDACSGCFALFIFHTIAWGVQHWHDTENLTVKPPQTFVKRSIGEQKLRLGQLKKSKLLLQHFIYSLITIGVRNIFEVSPGNGQSSMQ